MRIYYTLSTGITFIYLVVVAVVARVLLYEFK